MSHSTQALLAAPSVCNRALAAVCDCCLSVTLLQSAAAHICSAVFCLGSDHTLKAMCSKQEQGVRTHFPGVDVLHIHVCRLANLWHQCQLRSLLAGSVKKIGVGAAGASAKRKPPPSCQQPPSVRGAQRRVHLAAVPPRTWDLSGLPTDALPTAPRHCSGKHSPTPALQRHTDTPSSHSPLSKLGLDVVSLQQRLDALAVLPAGGDGPHLGQHVVLQQLGEVGAAGLAQGLCVCVCVLGARGA